MNSWLPDRMSWFIIGRKLRMEEKLENWGFVWQLFLRIFIDFGKKEGWDCLSTFLELPRIRIFFCLKTDLHIMRFICRDNKKEKKTKIKLKMEIQFLVFLF